MPDSANSEEADGPVLTERAPLRHRVELGGAPQARLADIH